MRSSLIYILILFMWICNLFAQNLVPNSSFENYNGCPNGQNTLWYADHWYEVNFFPNTPELLNSCAWSPSNSVPDNIQGYEFAHTGEGYAGIFGSHLSGSPNYSEYIRVHLVYPLQPNVEYEVSFYVSLADVCEYGVHLGAYLSQTDTIPVNDNLRDLVPQITSGRPLIKKNGWELIRGTFVSPTGGEHYLTIGNFLGDSVSGSVQQVQGGTDNKAYYFIDDVTVIHCSSMDITFSINDATTVGTSDGAVKIEITNGLPPYQYSIDSINFQSSSSFIGLASGRYTAYAKDSNGCVTKDTFFIGPLISTSHFSDVNGDSYFTVYPNPAKDILTIEVLRQATSFQLYDLLGKEVLITKLIIGTNRIKLENLTNGLYLYKLSSESKIGRILVN